MVNPTNNSNHSSLHSVVLQQFLSLPPDMYVEILKRLNSLGDINACRLVCRQWDQLFKDHDRIWEGLFYRYFPNKTLIGKNFQASCRTLTNLTKGIGVLHTLKENIHDAFSLEVSGNKLISGSNDGITIWDLNTSPWTPTFEYSTNGVSALTMLGGQLICGDAGGGIVIYDLNEKKVTATFEKHPKAVSSFVISNDTLISGFWDGAIKTWNLKLKSKDCMTTLQEHTGAVSALAVSGNTLISGSMDWTVKIWTLNAESGTATLKDALEEQTGEVSALAISGNRLIVGSSNGAIRIWNLETKKCTGILKGHTGRVSSFHVFGDMLISGSWDGTIKIWNLETKKCTGILKGNKGDRVHSLGMFDGKLIYGSDSMIKVWDFTVDYNTFFMSDPMIAEQVRERFLLTREEVKESNILVDLGIFANEDYLEKLNCRPEYLQKIGILSSEI